MTSLRGNNGPRYRHTVDESAPYETIAIDTLTPIIGAEIAGAAAVCTQASPCTGTVAVSGSELPA